jgi:hypothetical protein
LPKVFSAEGSLIIPPDRFSSLKKRRNGKELIGKSPFEKGGFRGI